MTEHEVLEYCCDIMKSKGYDPRSNIDIADIFQLQKGAWIDAVEKHGLRKDAKRRQEALDGFVVRNVIGGAGKILASFSEYLTIKWPVTHATVERTGVEPWRGDRGTFHATSEDLERAKPILNRMGIDPNAPLDVQRKQFRKWIVNLKYGAEGPPADRNQPKRKPRKEIDNRVLIDVIPTKYKHIEAPKEETTWTEADEAFLNIL